MGKTKRNCCDDDWLVKKYEAEKSSGGVRKEDKFCESETNHCAVKLSSRGNENGIPM
jgi:hypothetical protein